MTPNVSKEPDDNRTQSWTKFCWFLARHIIRTFEGQWNNDLTIAKAPIKIFKVTLLFSLEASNPRSESRSCSMSYSIDKPSDWSQEPTLICQYCSYNKCSGARGFWKHQSFINLPILPHRSSIVSSEIVLLITILSGQSKAITLINSLSPIDSLWFIKQGTGNPKHPLALQTWIHYQTTTLGSHWWFCIW